MILRKLVLSLFVVSGLGCMPSSTCDDGRKNGDEDFIDCGGSCGNECAECQGVAVCEEHAECEIFGEGSICREGCCYFEGDQPTMSCTGAASDGSDLTVLGECVGDVLRRCDLEEGALELTCSRVHRECGQISEELGYDCLIPVGESCTDGIACGGEEPGCLNNTCEQNVGTCTVPLDSEFSPECMGDVAVLDCLQSQPMGRDCAAQGGLCDQGYCTLPVGEECAERLETTHHCEGVDAGCVLEVYDFEGVAGSSCVENLGTCTAADTSFSPTCVGDTLLMKCAEHGQPVGMDCISVGGASCSESLCRNEVNGYCGGERWGCAEGLRCEEQTCVPN